MHHTLSQAIGILYIFSHIILIKNLWDTLYHQPYVSDEEIEAQEGKMILWKSYR